MTRPLSQGEQEALAVRKSCDWVELAQSWGGFSQASGGKKRAGCLEKKAQVQRQQHPWLGIGPSLHGLPLQSTAHHLSPTSLVEKLASFRHLTQALGG